MCKFLISHERETYSSSKMSSAEFFGIFKKAAKLTKDPCNGCRVVTSQRHFALPPRYIGQLRKGAMATLESEIGRYSESLNGVPLAYCNVTLKQERGTILDDQPFIHFDVSYKAVIFQPAIGSILKCVVNEHAGDHVSCLVHNWFNLSLPLRASADLASRLPRGSKVMGKVTRLQAKNGILAIQATPEGERFSDLQMGDTSDPSAIKSEPMDDLNLGCYGDGKKQKHDSGFISDPENKELTGPLGSLDAAGDGEMRKKKKKKKKKEEAEPELEGIVIKTEPRLESPVADHSSLDSMVEDVKDVSIDSSEESVQRKEKKKKKKKHSHGDDSSCVVKVKEEIIDDGYPGQKYDVERKEEVGLSEGGQGDFVSTDRVKMENVQDCEDERDSSQQKKRKRDKKSAHVEEEVLEMNSETATDDGTVARKKKKKKKRPHSPVDEYVNGHGDHDERTTQDGVCGTEVDHDGVSAKKKKKMKRYISV